MSWQASSLALLGLALAAGFAWYEREKPPARVLAVVAALAALAVVGRLAFAAFPNVKPTTDIVLFAGYALGAVPGFAVGAVTAIVSNIFLSQGPWTVWQMAGWGAVGVGGAVLAKVLRGREPNRFMLAGVCGLAGLLFGAWMDIYQWTFAARQDLDTYIAVAGTSLPYNVAHAVGNVVFCLLLGPAFLRALARYRRRLEVRWDRSPAPIVASVVALALVLAVPAVAAAATPAERAETYLLRAQNKDGGFGAGPKLSSSPLYSGWAGLGLASAGRNPRDVKRSGGRSAAAYVLRGSSSLRDIGEIERTVLLARAAGMDPRRFGGRNLLAEIEKRRRGDGSISGFVSYTAFGVMALRASGASAGSSTVQWLVGSQNGDGGFGVARSSSSDSDMTGAALQALATVGRAQSATAQGAVSWLRANQNGDGGFGQFKGRDSNSQSTSYASPGAARGGRRRRHAVSRARLPRSPAAKRRERGLFVVERTDARVGDGAGADGAERQAAPDRHATEEQESARQGGVRRRRRRGGRSGRRQGRLEERQGRRERSRGGRGHRRRRSRRRGSRGRRDRSDGARRDGPGEHLRARGSGTRERGCEAEARAGVGGAARGSRPARAPVGDQPVRAAGALARHGIVRA